MSTLSAIFNLCLLCVASSAVCAPGDAYKASCNAALNPTVMWPFDYEEDEVPPRTADDQQRIWEEQQKQWDEDYNQPGRAYDNSQWCGGWAEYIEEKCLDD